jgi:hypothetical protein
MALAMRIKNAQLIRTANAVRWMVRGGVFFLRRAFAHSDKNAYLCAIVCLIAAFVGGNFLKNNNLK